MNNILFPIYLRQTLLVIAALIWFTPGFSQEHEEESEHYKHHRIAAIISHTHIPKGYHTTQGDKAIVVPSWGINYEYWFNPKWAIGIHNDMEIANYIIKTPDKIELERERPFITSVVGIYKPWKGFEFVAGFGKEFEKNHNFSVYRFALEYELEIHHHWDVAPGLILDVKEDTYNSWTFGITIGRRF